MEIATKISEQNFPNAFNDTLRTNMHASLFNDKLQFPDSCNKFEYIYIMVSHNTVLPAHFDRNSNNRPGYDHTVVYTYTTKVYGKLFCVAVIMCTRTVVGANKTKLMIDSK